uniref:PNPLA domain-containing protein n=1 Tax=Bursaphelenchus xylophilus TaxID=6326 RepID=A0A1I7S2F2_BURXY
MSSDSEASSMGRLLWDMIKGNYDGLVQTGTPPLTLKSVSASGFGLMQCIMALEEIGGQKVQKEIIKEKNRLLNTAADWGDLLRAVGNEMGPKRNMVKLFYKHEHVLQATPEKNNDIARAVGVNSFEPTLQPLNFVSDPTGRYLKYFIDKEYQVKARIPEVVPVNTRIRSTARLLVTNGLAVELDWDCPLVPGEDKFSIKPMANEQDTVRVPTLELAKDCVDFQVSPEVSAIYFNGKNANVEAVVIYVSGDKEHALHMLDYETIEMAMEMGRQGQKARMTLVLPQPKSVEPISLRLVNAKTKLTGEGRLKRVAMNLYEKS